MQAPMTKGTKPKSLPSARAIGMGGLGFLSPSSQALLVFGASGSIPVFGLDRWWTVLSAGWLHGGVLHILFNMMALRSLGPPTAEMYGPARMVIIYVLASVGGFFLSSVAGAYFPDLFVLRGGRFTVGASASISGLLGAMLYYGHRSGSSMARAWATQNAIMLIMIGFLMPAIDNYAHLGGFGTGYAVGRMLDPLKPERADHTAIALVLLAVSILSVVVSVVTIMLL